MSKLHLFLWIYAIPFIASGQSTEKFRGLMPTRISSGGEATYYYYIGENKQPIKHGRFKYTLRQTRGSSKIYQDITGNYSNGYKDGKWTYRTKFRDYKMERSSNYLTGTMALTATYDKGIPHGKWNFRYTCKTREQEPGSSRRINWTSYTNSSPVILSMKFNQMTLYDSVFIQSDNGDFAEGVLSQNGYLNGNWYLVSQNHFIREQYDDGLLYKKEVFDKKDTLLVESMDYSTIEMQRRDNIKKLQEMQPANLLELTYTLDTTSILKTNHVIPAMINQWIFENPYLLFNDLDGDNYEISDLTGGYTVQVVNHITPEQDKKIALINKHLAEFKQVNIRIENLCRGKSISDRTLSTIQLMTYYERMAEKYFCLANSLTSLPDLKDAKNVCQQNCKNTVNLTNELPDFQSRDEAISFFLHDLNKKSQSMHAYEDMLRKELAFK